jgi:hypothetical protein
MRCPFSPIVGIWLLAGAAGCAPAYHSYPNGCVQHGYCAPPPLLYRKYCACPAPIAQCLLSGQQDKMMLDTPPAEIGDSSGEAERD